MTTYKGIAALTVLIIIAGLLVIGGAGYLIMNPMVSNAPSTEENVQTEAEDTTELDQGTNKGVTATGKVGVVWKITSAGEIDGIPKTKVTLVLSGTPYETGTFDGSCREMDGTADIGGGLLAGELSGVQCWYAGGGNEIGLFAHEDGGFDVMVGELGEPVPGESPEGFRGNFKIVHTIQ